MIRLTPAEEQVMLKLWQLEVASVKEIIGLYDEKRPAYNTTSTIVRILEKKKFIKHKAVGRGYVYQAKISKEEYKEYLLNWLIDNYYNGDASFLSASKKKTSLDEILGN